MKIKISILLMGLTILSSSAQQNLNDFLAAGVEDAQRFATNYVAPANDALAYGITAGWYNNAVTPNQFGFEISVLGNGVFIKDEHRKFLLTPSEYKNLRFPDDSQSKMVATALGHNNPAQEVVLTYDAPIFGGQEVTFNLPTGIAEKNINLVPTAFLQASFSLFRGTQLKARLVPKITQQDARIGLFGVGLQQDFTTFLPNSSLFPLTITGLVAYTQLNGDYDLQSSSRVSGENQRVETQVNTLLYQAIVGTKFKKVNFYGAVAYLDGESETNVLGTYRVTAGSVVGDDINDPILIKSDTKGVTTTLGANLKFGFFGLNAAYTIADFNSASLGMNLSF